MSEETDYDPQALFREDHPSDLDNALENLKRFKFRPAPITGVARKRSKWTPRAQQRYLEALAKFGRPALAARVAGVSAMTVREALKDDEELSELHEEALDLYRDMIDLEIQRRGVEGVLEPVIGGKDKDVIVTWVRKYSDACLLASAKRHIPEYREKMQIDATVSTGVLAVTGGNHSSQEWESQWLEKRLEPLEGEYKVLEDASK